MLADADESSELTDRISFDLERSGNQVARATSPQGLGCLWALQGAERSTQRYSVYGRQDTEGGWALPDDAATMWAMKPRELLRVESSGSGESPSAERRELATRVAGIGRPLLPTCFGSSNNFRYLESVEPNIAPKLPSINGYFAALQNGGGNP